MAENFLIRPTDLSKITGIQSPWKITLVTPLPVQSLFSPSLSGHLLLTSKKVALISVYVNENEVGAFVAVW